MNAISLLHKKEISMTDIVEKLLKSKSAGAKVAGEEILMLRRTVAEAAIEAARSRAPSVQLGSGWPEIFYP